MRTATFRRLLAIGIGAATVVLAAPGAASATVTATATAAFSGAVPQQSAGASQVSYCGGTGQGRCSGTFARVAWGWPVNGAAQTRLDFLPAPAGDGHAPGEPFAIGDLHFVNTGIQSGSGITSVRLNLSVAVSDQERGTAFPVTLTLPLQVDVTPNDGPGCPYGSAPPCADAILLPPAVPARYDVGGATYQVDVLGFANSQSSSGLSSRLVAQENDDVVGPLMVRVTRDVDLGADAGTDQAVDENMPVTLDGSGSEGDELTYAWRQVSGPEVTLDDPAASSPTFTAPRVAQDQTLEFELTVSEAADPAVTDTDSVLVTVRDVNEAPVLSLPDDMVVTATGTDGAVVTFEATSTDPDGDEPVVDCRPASGTEFPVGTTIVACTATDAAGAVDTGSFTVRVNAPPVLRLPTDVVVDATTPSGTPVAYQATATDDGTPLDAACTPRSGTTFPIGTTAVECSATDADGATTSGTFGVTVRGASAQLADLQTDVTGVGPGRSLAAKIGSAVSAVSAGRTSAACDALQGFLDEVRAQSGKHVAADTAALLVEDATRIRAVLACR